MALIMLVVGFVVWRLLRYGDVQTRGWKMRNAIGLAGWMAAFPSVGIFLTQQDYSAALLLFVLIWLCWFVLAGLPCVLVYYFLKVRRT